MAKDPKRNSDKPIGGYTDRWWMPRFWCGMNFLTFTGVLVRNRFQVHPSRIPMALVLLITSVANSVLTLLQTLVYGWRIARTEVREAPIFVIGHWRSGTTLLDEMLILDRRFAYPNTYACYAPTHFLVSDFWMRPWARFLLAKTRPMDNMPFGWDMPQEDEFAVCNMGLPSPYLGLIFPNRPPVYQEYLDMEGVAPESLRRWKKKFLWFVKTVTVANPKRLVLKSPPHTARIKTLLELFPDARFIHIYRDPHVLFASTVNLWKRLSRDQGLQKPNYSGLDEIVLRTLVRMYAAFERDRELVAPSRICDVNYEALVADPVGQMRRIYESLQLGGFDEVLPALEKYLASRADYKTNRYQLPPEKRAEVDRRWSAYMQKYGYASAEAQSK